MFKATEHKSDQADIMIQHIHKPQIHHKLNSTENRGNNSLKEPKLNKTLKIIYYLGFIKSPEKL